MVYLLQQGYAILYDSVLLQDLISRALVYIVQFAWSVFCFLSVGVCVPLYIGNSSCSILWSAQKQTHPQAWMLGSVSRVYWRHHQLNASLLISSCGKMLQNYFLVMHVSFQKLLTTVEVMNLSSHTRSWVMVPMGLRLEGWSWASLLNSWACYFSRGNLYVKLANYTINSHP